MALIEMYSFFLDRNINQKVTNFEFRIWPIEAANRTDEM